jgi:serine/threonine protein kinase
VRTKNKKGQTPLDLSRDAML